MDSGGQQVEGVGPVGLVARASRRLAYEQALVAMRAAFVGGLRQESAGTEAVLARSRAVDALVAGLWIDLAESKAAKGVALVAVGGYGRQELFPFSDVDLMFLLAPRADEAAVKETIRRMNQQMWDCGLRVSPVTRTLSECERFQPENVEFTLSLLDARLVAGDEALCARLRDRSLPRVIDRDRKRILRRLAEVTRLRHAKYGDTLFHLEPNIKDCPGGLRDAHVFGWLRRLAEAETPAPDPDFAEARGFLLLVRVFLHLRHGRDSNVLDWQAQDEAAAASLGVRSEDGRAPDAGYWMRLYFRHARSVERTEALLEEEVAPLPALRRVPLLRKLGAESGIGYEVLGSRLMLKPAGEAGQDPAHDPEVMLNLFGVLAQTGVRLSGESARRLEDGLPVLSNHLEDGHGLWLHLRRILLGRFAGRALRAMHQLGILELVLPEFHGIDALVIRDAYHRYTVDEHTFVLIDTLHALEEGEGGRGNGKQVSGMDALRGRFRAVLRDLPHPELLYLAALLHDTGKGRAGGEHAEESARMAARVLDSLEFDPREAGLVLSLIRNHLEMSAALRRDVFDTETVRGFAARVPTPEALRMLTLFTYADISAVHPDALTPWKAENLLSLHNNTAQYLDRLVDEQRLGGQDAPGEREDDPEMQALLARVVMPMPGRRAEVDSFVAGLPRRYLLTRDPAQVRGDVDLARRLESEGGETAELELRYAPEASELTVIARDRRLLFADIAGTLAAWGMNIVTAHAFSNARRLVVDTFRFTDTFRTLELNEPERARFLESVRGVVTGAAKVETLLAGRKRRARGAIKVKVMDRVDFDAHASSHSTLLQVVAQDTPGLLHTVAKTLAGERCNIEVALIDTEGDRAIDVFYLTRDDKKLDDAAESQLRKALLEALETHAR